jgi:hypothetical protein
MWPAPVRLPAGRCVAWARGFRPSGRDLRRPADGTPIRPARTQNCIGSTETADAPGCAAASDTAADNAPAAAATDAAATSATAASAANTAATSAATAATTASTAAATTTASAAAAAARYLREAAGAVFLVKEVERRKTYVHHFLFAENEALIGLGVRRLRNVRSRKRGCRCASNQ